MKAEIKLLNVKPFNYVPFNEKLPSLPISIKEYSDKVDDGINTLKFGNLSKSKSKYNNQIKLINSKSPQISSRHKKILSENIISSSHKNDLFNKLSNKNEKLIKLSESLRKKYLSNSNEEINKNKILNNNNNNNKLIKVNNSLPEIHCLTDRTINKKSRNLSNDLFNNYDSNSINQYFFTSLNNLTEDANIEIYNLKHKKKVNSKYNKKMIVKCDKRLRKFNNKMIIDTDEFITERFKPWKNNFNKYFDNLIVGDKNFDIKSMINILNDRKKPKNKILREIRFDKIEEKHKNFKRLIESNEIDLKNFRKNFYKLVIKS